MNRSAFLRKCAAAGIGGAGLSILLEACGTSNYYAQHAVENRMIRFSRTEFEVIKDGKGEKRGFVLIKNNLLEFPICVYRFDDESFVALSLRCTHQGCEVEPQHDFLVCPCHGSEYSNRGKVINPPAEHDLQQYPVIVRDGYLTIQLV